MMLKPGLWLGVIWSYPLVNLQKAIENGPVEIVDLPINSMVIFHSNVQLPEGKLNKFWRGFRNLVAF